MVIGDRQVETIEHFSAPKKLLQRLGSWVVRHASATEIPDTTSGFRAYNREAALQVQAVSKFTYTLETIIQAGRLQVAVDHVPIRTNPKTRESRLFPSTAAYVRRNALSIFRVYSQYQPLRVFWTGALILGVAAVAIFIRFLVFFVQHPDAGTRHIQELIAGGVLFNAAMLLGALGVIGDLLDAQRTLSQRTFERVRRIELQLGVEPSHYEPRRAGGREPKRHRRRGHGREQTPPAPATAQTRPPAPTAPDRKASRYEPHSGRRPRRRRPHRGPDRQHVRQVRLDEPGRAPADVGLRGHARSGCSTAPRPESVLDVGCGEGVLTYKWAQALGDRPVLGIDLADPKLEAEWSTRAAPEPRVPRDDGRGAAGSPVPGSVVRPRRRDRGARARPRPRAHARRDGASGRPPPARLGPARAAVAGAERRPGRVRARPRQHPGPRQPLVQARASCGWPNATARWSRRARRSRGRCCWCASGDAAARRDDRSGAAGDERRRRAAPDGAPEGPASPPTPRARASCRSGSPRPASSRSSTWPPRATRSIRPPTAGSRCAGRSCS